MTTDVSLLRVQQRVEAQLSALIRQVRDLVDQTQPQNNDMKRSQLDNFLGVSRETNSVAVVENWVRYQIGRKQGAWNRRRFGETVLADIAGWQATAEMIAQEVYSQAEAPAQVERVWITLIRQYAGQLRRYFAYVSQEEAHDDE